MAWAFVKQDALLRRFLGNLYGANQHHRRHLLMNFATKNKYTRILVWVIWFIALLVFSQPTQPSEIALTAGGQQWPLATRHLYRAVDSTGQTLDFLLNQTKSSRAAKRFFRKALGQPNITALMSSMSIRMPLTSERSMT